MIQLSAWKIHKRSLWTGKHERTAERMRAGSRFPRRQPRGRYQIQRGVHHRMSASDMTCFCGCES